MAGKLIELKDAAAALGVTPEQLTEMRSKGEIFGYRDGATWKFKEEEIERVRAARSDQAASGSGLDLDDLVSVSDLDSESILVTDESVGGSSEGTASTIIGKTNKPDHSGESDIKLGSDSAIKKDGSGKGSGKGSDVALVLDAGTGSGLSLAPQGSDVLAGGSDKKKGDSPSTAKPVMGGSDLKLGDDDLGLNLDSPSGHILSGGSDKPKAGSGVISDLSLGEDESALGSDVSLGASDSGINLGSPSQSGISLETPPAEIAASGSNVASFELGEDPDMISLEATAADPEAATQLKADDAFLLEPGEGGLDDSDSGSQVIPLEDTAEIDQEAQTMLASALPEESPLLEEEPLGGAAAGALVGAGMPMMMPQQPEATYSVWNVLSLFFVTVFLAIAGIMMGDLLSHMYDWQATDTPGGASSALMDSIIEAVGGKK